MRPTGRNIVWYIVRALDEAVTFAEAVALEKGIVKGHNDYQKFIILGKPRTGSNLLSLSLTSHRQIVCFSELFNPRRRKILWGYPGYRIRKRSRGLLKIRDRQPVTFIDTYVFRPYRRRVKAVGFKIFYFHCRGHDQEHVWPYLQNLGDLKIVHIKRRNMLKAHLSTKTAFLAEKWLTFDSNTLYSNIPMALNYEECVQAFETTKQKERQLDTFFADHEKLNVLYEDLSSNFAKETKRVQEFLGVEEATLPPKTKKQRIKPLSHLIKNYAELKDRFEGTPWIEFFDG